MTKSRGRATPRRTSPPKRRLWIAGSLHRRWTPMSPPPTRLIEGLRPPTKNQRTLTNEPAPGQVRARPSAPPISGGVGVVAGADGQVAEVGADVADDVVDVGDAVGARGDVADVVGVVAQGAVVRNAAQCAVAWCATSPRPCAVTSPMASRYRGAVDGRGDTGEVLQARSPAALNGSVEFWVRALRRSMAPAWPVVVGSRLRPFATEVADGREVQHQREDVRAAHRPGSPWGTCDVADHGDRLRRR